ncbi:unnamed protein product [Adineta ricciae]|uniref:UBA domain-containing protein n=1 Tax=Adineta ricciae TaxID=249248 RepID=A0A814TGY4_ADIRI|nr:unnamed protein product [Adineta ricciae]
MADTTSKKSEPVEVTDWNGLVKYAELLCQNTDKKFKICMIDEEQEEIRIENKDEFDTNAKYARDHGLKSLTLTVYLDNVHVFDGIYHLRKSPAEICVQKSTAFPSDKLQNLRANILVDKWYIPVKLDEALGICLTAAIKLAQEGTLDTNADCKQFIETIVPEAFRKLQTTQSVFSWPRDVQVGIFDMIELLVDLVATRIRYAPVPITLLNVLALTFDTNTTFSQKHKNDKLPEGRVYVLEGDEFFRTNPNQTESYDWLRSLIQRFIIQNGLNHIRAQFERIKAASVTQTTTMEYNCLLKLFSKCHQCINAERFRLLFTPSIRQAIQHLHQTKKTALDNSEQLSELNETLIEVCFCYEMNDEVNEILEIPTTHKPGEAASAPPPLIPLIVPMKKLTVSKKPKSKDCYEQLAETIQSLAMDKCDEERQSIKKQRTEEQVLLPLFSSNHVTDCTTDDHLSSSDKRSLKRKHRREQQRHNVKKENKRVTQTTSTTYDRSDPADILRFFAPMKAKIANLYDDLQAATCHGNLREVLKIEEKLKLLRPYSACFIADENLVDGTSMEAGQVFRKGWILLNDGSMPWSSDDIELINLANGIKIVRPPVIPVTAPHDRAVITVDYMCANEPGAYESKWILSYRQRTFGPVIWCSIQVGSTTAITPAVTATVPAPPIEPKEAFELLDIPLPSCFDLTKPYQSTADSNSVRSSINFSRLNSTDTQTESLINTSPQDDNSDNDSLLTFTYSALPPPVLDKLTEMPLIALQPAIRNSSSEEGQQQLLRNSQSLDFVDTVVTNIFSVAKHAGSTAKAIFNTLQANDETNLIPVQQQIEPTTEIVNPPVNDDCFEHVGEDAPSNITNDPIQILIEMGFVNRQKNQRLLSEHSNDLTKVIEVLTAESNDDLNWFSHRH